MAVRKGELMRKEFGYGPGTCNGCIHLIRSVYDQAYYKCAVYGTSRCESTDWKLSENACGLKNKSKEYVKRYKPIVRMVERKKKDTGQPVSGQISLFDMEGRNI